MAHIDESVFYDKIFPHFQKICTFPHPSGEERELVDFIIHYANQLKLHVESDDYGNIAVYRKSSKGLDRLPPLLFQGHLDMVCLPDKNIFPIQPKITEGWVHTEGTTLGADNGIGIAIMMGLMEMPFEKNPPLEFLFTVSEEIGLVGASKIDLAKIHLKSLRLINIDSEEIQYITIGCAGGKDFNVVTKISREPNVLSSAFAIIVSAPGGHSGLKIHEKIPNAIKIAAEFVQKIAENYPVVLSEFTGGSARNAIPPNARATVCSKGIPEKNIKMLTDEFIKHYGDFQPFHLTVDSVAVPEMVFSSFDTGKIIQLLCTLPHGVSKMNPDTGGVLSSVNLALVNTNNNETKISLNARSSDAQEFTEILDSVESICSKVQDTRVESGDSYPGWRPDIHSNLLRTTTEVFESVRGEKPTYLDIHAGLECGILMNMFPSIKESVSIGPNLHNAHSIEEKLEIASTVEIWEIILKLIQNYSESRE